MSNNTPVPDELAALIRESNLAMKARLEELAARKDPGGALLTSLNDEAMKWIGYIVSQWGMLEDQVDGQISWHSNHSAAPQELVGGTPRREFRQRLAHLEKLANATLANERPEALPAFRRNLSRIANFKQVRDHLVHGHYSLQDQDGFSGVGVIHEGKKHRYSANRLHAVAIGIGQCSGFFLNFWAWCHAPKQLASLGKSPEQDLLQTMIVTPHGPQPPPESSQA